MSKKVTVIGAGNVGASLAQLVAQSGLADVVIVDIIEGVPQGKALDIYEACPLYGSGSYVEGTNEYGPTEGSDIVVITAGFARKPGMSRDDLLMANAQVVGTAASDSAKASPNAVMIVVTNPMDAMAYQAQKSSGFPHQRVIGMGGILDASRFRSFVALELGVKPSDVEALVLGGHGDEMVPAARYATVMGIPITELLSAERIDALVERTKKGGAEIVGLLKTGSAYYAPAAATFEMVRAVLLDERKILPSSVYAKGYYGLGDVYVGLPAVIGAGGAEKIIELPLTPDEKAALERSADSVSSLINKLK